MRHLKTTNVCHIQLVHVQVNVWSYLARRHMLGSFNGQDPNQEGPSRSVRHRLVIIRHVVVLGDLGDELVHLGLFGSPQNTPHGISILGGSSYMATDQPSP